MTSKMTAVAEVPRVLPVGSSSSHLAPLDPQTLLLKAVEQGAGIETLERLTALAKDVQAQMARQAWHDAMAAFQLACPPIRKTERVDIRATGMRYSFTPLDDLLAVTRPVMANLGLTATWRNLDAPANSVSTVCRIAHRLGHAEESGAVTIPVDTTSRMGANPAQRVGIALSYARRYAFLAIAGVAPGDEDTDANEPQAVPRATGEGPASATDPRPDERAVLLAAITETANVLRLSTDARRALWVEAVGDVKAEHADLAALSDLLRTLRARVPEPSA